MGARNLAYVMSLAGIDIRNKADDELREIFRNALKDGMHGLCFSPYEDNQGPGATLTEEQVRRRLEIIRPYTNWVRTFSTTDVMSILQSLLKKWV